jgi:hypothetical protein
MATGTSTPVPTAAATPVETAESTSTATATEFAPETARVVADTAGAVEPIALPPGLLFFLGGAVVLVAAVALTYDR